MTSLQLEFFKSDEQCEIDSLRFEINEIRTSTHKVRKKLFQENGNLNKLIKDLCERMEIIERNLCKGNDL